MRKKTIRKRWEVAGVYRFCKETSLWKYECEFFDKKAVWEFDRRSVTCYYSDGKHAYSVPYTFIGPDKLLIDYWTSQLYFDPYYEVYFLRMSGNDLFLCEIDPNTPGRSWQAIKLTQIH